MFTEIKKLLSEGNYSDAITSIKLELDKKFDLLNPESEKEYKELLKLRITCHTLMGKDDTLILDQIRKEKYPSEIFYQVEGKLKINLYFRSIFDFKSDAFVNTIDAQSPFKNVTDNSATSEFIKRVGSANIESQLNEQGRKTTGDYVMLNHQDLSAPISYQILYYNGKTEPDFSLLETGINKVLADAIKNNLKSICFFPLGYAYVVSAPKEDKNRIADEISAKIAEIVISYYFDNRNKSFPEINFCFASVMTMLSFDRGFNKWTKYDKSQINQIKHLPIKERLFVESLLTKDVNFINSLKSIFYIINEKNTVLILGETGVGKTHLAKMIYNYSDRWKGPFIELNCALIKPENIYPQLFGWKKGSFTDAKEDGSGAIEAAEGGILFLDEIGYANIEVQRMLLKFLDDGVYSRNGENEIQRESNVKLIFGTNVNIEEKILDKTFAHDFYERISQYSITIPPLRDRREDIAILTLITVEKLNKINNQNIVLSDDALNKLGQFDWPGNIRQLKNYLEQLYLLTKQKNEIKITDKHIASTPPRNVLLLIDNPIEKLESDLKKILKSWNISDGNIVDSLVHPILAKIYVEDFDWKKEDAMKILGLDGTRGKASNLNKKLEQYPQIKNIQEKN